MVRKVYALKNSSISDSASGGAFPTIIQAINELEIGGVRWLSMVLYLARNFMSDMSGQIPRRNIGDSGEVNMCKAIWERFSLR